jgi:polyhydroxyalkanoate synthase subunit PhaC
MNREILRLTFAGKAADLSSSRAKGKKMAKKPSGLNETQDAGVALNPLVGLAREDLASAVGVMLRATATQPKITATHAKSFSDDLIKIFSNKSELAPAPKDRRFADAAWSQNPLFKFGMQYYLAAEKGIKGWIDDIELDDIERTRAHFVAGMVIDSLSPTNALISNPAAIKKAVDTGGASLLRGLKNAYDDIVNNDGLVSQVDKRPFKIGENIANTPGAVIHRSEIMELIQYQPSTERVHQVPLLIIPPQINKAYVNDLSPEKSLIRYQLENGLQPFMISWRNPSKEHRDWGLAHYVDAIIEAIGIVCEITGSKQVNVSGACSGGITMATMLSKMAAKKDKRIASISLMVCVLQPEITDSDVGALVSENGIELARQRSAKAGVLDGASLARMFAWLRPNDLVWNYVVNNYLLGEAPPAFDILFWNNDATNLTAALHSDYLDLYGTQPFARPGESIIADHAVDIRKVESDIFMVAGVTDHITPWKACYRSTQLFGSKNIEFILSQSGHIQAMLNPPGNPKSKYFRAEGKPPETPEKWMKKAEEHAGSWWPYWMTWLKSRSGVQIIAPKTLGSTTHPIVGMAPGEYALG